MPLPSLVVVYCRSTLSSPLPVTRRPQVQVRPFDMDSSASAVLSPPSMWSSRSHRDSRLPDMSYWLMVPCQSPSIASGNTGDDPLPVSSATWSESPVRVSEVAVGRSSAVLAAVLSGEAWAAGGSAVLLFNAMTATIATISATMATPLTASMMMPAVFRRGGGEGAGYCGG